MPTTACTIFGAILDCLCAFKAHRFCDLFFRANAEPGDRITPFPLMRGQKRRFYNSNLKYFYNFPGLSAEKCQALYGINRILVSIVKFKYICFAQWALDKNWFFYAESFCCWSKLYTSLRGDTLHGVFAHHVAMWTTAHLLCFTPIYSEMGGGGVCKHVWL